MRLHVNKIVQIQLEVTSAIVPSLVMCWMMIYTSVLILMNAKLTTTYVKNCASTPRALTTVIVLWKKSCMKEINVAVGMDTIRIQMGMIVWILTSVMKMYAKEQIQHV